MKTQFLITLAVIAFAIVSSSHLFGQNKKRDKNIVQYDTLNYAFDSGKSVLEVVFQKGESFNHPTFVIWIEDLEGNYIKTVFLTKSFATGIYSYADGGNGTWKSEQGESIRPAALPYWSHKRIITNFDGGVVPTPENPVIDAISGATPNESFVMKTNLYEKTPTSFRILLEINQTWDWNSYWTNNKYPDDNDYKSSSQPSVIYSGDLNTVNPTKIILQPIGHGHYAGKDGSLTTNLSTLTTALKIVKQIEISLID